MAFLLNLLISMIISGFWFLSSSFHKIMVLLCNVFVFMFISSWVFNVSWFSFIFMLACLSGLMVLFIYMASLSSSSMVLDYKFGFCIFLLLMGFSSSGVIFLSVSEFSFISLFNSYFSLMVLEVLLGVMMIILVFLLNILVSCKSSFRSN